MPLKGAGTEWALVVGWETPCCHAFRIPFFQVHPCQHLREVSCPQARPSPTGKVQVVVVAGALPEPAPKVELVEVPGDLVVKQKIQANEVVAAKKVDGARNPTPVLARAFGLQKQKMKRLSLMDFLEGRPRHEPSGELAPLPQG